MNPPISEPANRRPRQPRGPDGLGQRVIQIALLASLGLALALFGGTSGQRAAALELSPQPSVVGAWSAPIDWPVIATHAAVLPPGKVLHWRATEAWLFDSNGAKEVSLDRDIFCSSQTLLSDGRLLVAGGHETGQESSGIRDLHTFDPFSGTWEYVGDMGVGRWYPTSVALPDGRTLILSGRDEQGELTDLVEVYDPASGIQVLAGANRFIATYPRMHVLPSGKVFHAGPEPFSSTFDPASLAWQEVASNNYGYRGGGASVLLPLQPPDYQAKVLILGGGEPATDTAEIIDLGESVPTWRFTASMNQGRRNLNVVVLPDGNVLVVGGGKAKEAEGPVLEAEIFDPVTETWTAVASMERPRVYHSTAILLPDGRVLAAGSDGEHTAEIYSPSYLFRGPRPQISSAPDAISYGSSFQLPTPDAQEIVKVVLIRPAAMTHSVNMEQRYLELEFETGADLLTVQAPPSGNLAPPGYYMLFVVNSEGVPSEAAFTRVDPSLDGDGDGFSDATEAFIGTDPNLACGPGAWPPDFDDDGTVSIADLLALKPSFNSQSGDEIYDQRLDLTADGKVSIADVLALKPVFNLSCA